MILYMFFHQYQRKILTVKLESMFVAFLVHFSSQVILPSSSQQRY